MSSALSKVAPPVSERYVLAKDVPSCNQFFLGVRGLDASRTASPTQMSTSYLPTVHPVITKEALMSEGLPG